MAAEAARALLDNFYFNSKRYDLAKVGRYKINRKLGIDAPLGSSVLSREDILATIKYLVALHNEQKTLPGIRDGKRSNCVWTSTTSTTSATAASAPSASSSRTRCAPACPA